MGEKDLLETFSKAGYFIRSEKLYQTASQHILTFNLTNRGKQKCLEKEVEVQNQKFLLQLKTEVSDDPSKTNFYLLDVSDNIEEKLLLSESTNWVQPSPPRSFMQAMGNRQPFLHTHKVSATEVQRNYDSFKFQWQIDHEKGSVIVFVNWFQDITPPQNAFSPRNVGQQANVGEAAAFFRSATAQQGVTLWEYTFEWGGRLVHLQKVALEGVIWNKKNGHYTLMGRYRKEMPRYCTYYELTDGSSREIFIDDFGPHLICTLTKEDDVHH